MAWYDKYLSIYGKSFYEVPHNIVGEIRRRLAAQQSNQPLISIVMIAYNDELRLASCLWSLSEFIDHIRIQEKGILRAFYKTDYYKDSDDNLIKS